METTPIRPFQVARDGDRHAAHRKVGIGTLFFKVTTADSTGHFRWSRLHTTPKAVLLDIYIAIRTSGSTSIEGAYIVEIGDERYLLGPGNSAFGPRGVPHCWVNVSEGPGRITFVFTPAGQAEAFFLEINEGRRDGSDGPSVLATIPNGIGGATRKSGMTLTRCSITGGTWSGTPAKEHSTNSPASIARPWAIAWG